MSRESFLDRHYAASDFYNRVFSGGTYSTWVETQKILEQFCSGLTLDAGSGRGAWKSTIPIYTAEYKSIEIAPRGGHVPTWLGDIIDMSVVPNERYDTVFCQQVLEHVPQPFDAVREIHRVLKPDGKLILTVHILVDGMNYRTTTTDIHKTGFDIFLKAPALALHTLLDMVEFSPFSITRRALSFPAWRRDFR